MTEQSSAPHSLGKADRTIHLLSATSVGADIVAFLKFHMVFTSAMTGNLALFGVAVGQGHLLSATHSLSALLGFIVGIVLGSVCKDHHYGLRILLFLEILFLGVYALVWVLVGFRGGGISLYVLIMTSALSMGLQSVAARLIDVAGVPSVVYEHPNQHCDYIYRKYSQETPSSLSLASAASRAICISDWYSFVFFFAFPGYYSSNDIASISS